MEPPAEPLWCRHRPARWTGEKSDISPVKSQRVYLRHFAIHLFAVLIIHVGDDARDGGPHFLDGAHVSAVGGACASPGGRRLSFPLFKTERRSVNSQAGSVTLLRHTHTRSFVPCQLASAAPARRSWSAGRRCADGAETRRTEWSDTSTGSVRANVGPKQNKVKNIKSLGGKNFRILKNFDNIF